MPAFQKELEELGKKEIELLLEQKVNLPEECLIGPDEIGALVESGIIEAPDTEEANKLLAESSAIPG